ncbi:type I polyketide synthase, partial [Streptomyces sp. NPDC001388]|uniref:type I polyketide synthase n=1 Tax=Streptomyces sp. NPDC001388 TaxID=3364568 RepID=UPI003686CAA8
MSIRFESLDELHSLISEGRLGRDEALRALRDWQRTRAQDPAGRAGTAAPARADDVIEAVAERICAVLVEKVCGLLKVTADDLDVDVDLSEYGLDSIVITQLVHLVNESLGLELAPTALFEHPTIRAFGTHLAQEHGPRLAARLGVRTPAEPTAPAAPVAVGPVTVPPPEPPASPTPVSAPHPGPGPSPDRAGRRDTDPIAVIGVSGRFPMARDLDTYWKNLVEGRDCVTEVPADRWDWQALFGDPLRESGRTDVKWGGFMDGVADFDPQFFGIAPKDALHMDPQQRLLMLYVWKALEDAGYAADALAGGNLGLFVGTHDTGYGLLAERGGARDGNVAPTGGVPSIGPNRMSYFLDVHGPSEPVETACSSALVALHRAVAALERGESDMAVAGAVNTIIVPDGHIAFSKAGMLSPEGRCKTFSDRADGYARGEGVGMLV